MANKITVNLDTSKNQYNIYDCKQNDDLILEAKIYESGKEKDVSAAEIIVNCTRSDGTYVIQNTEITKEKNKIVANLKRDFTRVAGLDRLELVLIENGKQNTTFDFNILVKPSVLKAAVEESKNTVTILEELGNKIVEAGQAKAETENLIATGNAATKGDIANVASSLEQMENVKVNIGQVKEEISKVQLAGANIDTSNFILNSNILNFDGGILDINTPSTIWEKGFINTTGQLVDDNTQYRTKDYINFDIDKEYTVYMINGNGCIFRFYNDDDTFKQSLSVTATTSTATRKFTPPSKKAKIVINWYSSSYPISTDNFKLITTTNISSAITDILNNNVMFKSPQSNDFDDLINGSYWVSVGQTTSTTNPLLNAPDGIVWGNFAVIGFKILSGYYVQFAITSTNSLGKYGAYVRVFTKGSNVIRWSQLNTYFLKSEDNYSAFGDSITHGYLRTENSLPVLTNYQYWKTVGSTLNLNASEGANTGSGYVLVQGNKNALRIIEEYDFTNVNLSTFAFGTNDWNGNIPLGSINDTPVNGNVNTSGTYTNTTNTIYSAIKYCVEKALSQNPKMTLILITPINRSQAGNSGATLTKENNWGYGARNTAGYTLNDVCQAVVDVAKYYGIRYIDNREGCPINRLNLNSLTTDGLHPNDWGYMKLGQYYAGQIGAIYRPYQR